MTSVESVLSLDTGAIAVRERPLCAACTHDLDGHDAISQRYCQATQANALSRKCICPTG
jgi:hypothetical protein